MLLDFQQESAGSMVSGEAIKKPVADAFALSFQLDHQLSSSLAKWPLVFWFDPSDHVDTHTIFWPGSCLPSDL